MLEKERSRPKVTHIPPLVGSVGLNSVSPRRRVPAEPRRSASAHNVKYNEGRGGVELMMMLMRMMRIKMMTAVLCFPLTLPPWSDFFHLRSCLLKYIQLSSADQRAPPRCVAPPLSHEIPASHCSALQQSTIHVHIVFSFVNRQLPGSAGNPSHVPSKPVLHMFPLWLK